MSSVYEQLADKGGIVVVVNRAGEVLDMFIQRFISQATCNPLMLVLFADKPVCRQAFKIWLNLITANTDWGIEVQYRTPESVREFVKSFDLEFNDDHDYLVIYINDQVETRLFDDDDIKKEVDMTRKSQKAIFN